MSTRTHGNNGYHPNQTSLISIDPASQQTMAALWQYGVDQAQQRLAKREIKNRKRIEHIVVRAHEQGFHWTTDDKLLALLEAPLGRYLESDLDVQPAPEPVAVEDLAEEVQEEKIEWSDDAIAQLHEGVLFYSLGILNSKGNAEEKRKTLDWIWSEDVVGFVPKTVLGVLIQQPVRADQIPFTFQTCCRLSGVNYDELREGLRWDLRSVLTKLGFKPKTTWH